MALDFPSFVPVRRIVRSLINGSGFLVAYETVKVTHPEISIVSTQIFILAIKISLRFLEIELVRLELTDTSSCRKYSSKAGRCCWCK